VQIIKTGQVVRALALMSHPIPGANDAHSVQLILPQKQLGRRSDIYVFCCSYTHNVAPKDRFLAFVSTTAETANPAAEINAGLALLGHVDEKFVEVVDVYEPLGDGTQYVILLFFLAGLFSGVNVCALCIHAASFPLKIAFVHSCIQTIVFFCRDKAFISKSFDATSHFETEIDDVLDMYHRITGHELDLDKEDLRRAQEQEARWVDSRDGDHHSTAQMVDRKF
jgi:Rab GDP dissociation inhibitor